MQSAFGVEHGSDQVSKGLIDTTMKIGTGAKNMGSNAMKGVKSGLGGWTEGGIGRVGAAGAKVGRGGAYALKNKKPIGIGLGVGATGIGAGALAT
jgi:hypothetical protein